MSESPIPKKLHFIWLGSKQPNYVSKFQKTFTQFAPGYTCRQWGDKDITRDNFPKTFDIIQKIKQINNTKIKSYIYRTSDKTMYNTHGRPYMYSKYAQISDLMRYEILVREGGYYFDVNMFLVKDITSILDIPKPLVLCNELGENLKDSDVISNSFIGCVPGNPVLKRFLTKSFLSKIDLKNPHVDEETGPFAFRSILKVGKDNYHVLPAKTFYPYILEWDPQVKHHKLRRSSKPKCTGPKRTKKRTLKMKPNLWLEFPCKQYKGCYGIKVWESGGSWTPPESFYSKTGSKQTGGVLPCVPCAVAFVNPGAIAAGVASLGALGMGAKKGVSYLKKKSDKTKKKKTKKTKKKSKKKSQPK